ncbi:GxxExxY protein [Patescibacteria group bacterium]|nr:GxxExxY protein [Patescibacteria group bacterium]
MTTNKIRLIYPELSYKIVGILFDIYNELGGGYQEKYYQRAITKRFKSKNIKFQTQISVPLRFDKEKIGQYFLDFLIEDKIILEIKISPRFYLRDIRQVLGYLKATNLQLAILASFTRNGLIFKRVINIKK